MRGPDAIKLISDTGDQQRRELPGRHGQAVRAHDARRRHVIGDGILFHLAEDEYVYVGRAPASNWLQFHAETGGYDVELEKRRPLARRVRWGRP